MKVTDVKRNLVPDTWTADGEGAPFPNWVRVLMTTAALVVEERRCRIRWWRLLKQEDQVNTPACTAHLYCVSAAAGDGGRQLTDELPVRSSYYYELAW